MNSNKKLKILLALDAFDDLADGQLKKIGVLKYFAHRAQVEIDPIYVLSPVELGLALEFSSEWAKIYAPSAKKALVQKLKGVSIPGLRDPRVLVQERASLKGTVETLTKLASNESYDLIVTGSHGRKGLQRMILGSFAEQLLLQSEVPVLIVGSHSRGWAEESDSGNAGILLPNDLVDSDSRLFPEVFDLAQTLGTKVTLLNSIPRPVEQVFQWGIYLLAGGWVPTPIYLEKERAKQQEVAEGVIAKARKRDIPCGIVIDDASPSVTESILSHAQDKNVRLIAMAAETGPITSALLGSITRQVVRAAPCPVLVYRFKGDR